MWKCCGAIRCLLQRLILLLLPLLADAACATWCNVHTCGMEPCASCGFCTLHAVGKSCEQWCNLYTCKDSRCAGCSVCNKKTIVEALNSSSSVASPPAAKRAPPGWGCCADRSATACDECRWWANGGFCTQHAVNCAKCSFSLYCSDPAVTPPPAPPAPPPYAPVDLQCHAGRLVDCRPGSSSASSCSAFHLKGVSVNWCLEPVCVLPVSAAAPRSPTAADGALSYLLLPAPGLAWRKSTPSSKALTRSQCMRSSI